MTSKVALAFAVGRWFSRMLRDLESECRNPREIAKRLEKLTAKDCGLSDQDQAIINRVIDAGISACVDQNPWGGDAVIDAVAEAIRSAIDRWEQPGTACN
ncbi:MAG: hypothetical protein JNK57_20560 [Planctomycetaceae bacterium]|nr:hypothetical protein [Planctomycetaceae bacterium]